MIPEVEEVEERVEGTAVSGDDRRAVGKAAHVLALAVGPALGLDPLRQRLQGRSWRGVVDDDRRLRSHRSDASPLVGAASDQEGRSQGSGATGEYADDVLNHSESLPPKTQEPRPIGVMRTCSGA